MFAPPPVVPPGRPRLRPSADDPRPCTRPRPTQLPGPFGADEQAPLPVSSYRPEFRAGVPGQSSGSQPHFQAQPPRPNPDPDQPDMLRSARPGLARLTPTARMIVSFETKSTAKACMPIHGQRQARTEAGARG